MRKTNLGLHPESPVEATALIHFGEPSQPRSDSRRIYLLDNQHRTARI